MRGQLCAVLMLLCGAVLTEEAIVDSESTIKLLYSLPNSYFLLNYKVGAQNVREMRTTDTGGDSSGVVSPSCIEILRGCDGRDGLPGRDRKDGELGKDNKENKGRKEIPGHKATLVCRTHLELMGEMVHQEEME